MIKNGARVIVGIFLITLLLSFQNCGAGGGGGDSGVPGATNSNWYFHFDCNGDPGCLSTNPTNGTYGDLNEGPVFANCSALIRFGNINWGSSAVFFCDNSPKGSVGGGGTGGLNSPAVTSISPSSGAPNITFVQIHGSNFPSSPSGVTATYCGRSINVQASTSTQVTVKIPYMASCKSPITLTTAAGSTNTPPFTVLNKFRSVAYSGSVFVVTGDYGTILTSTDGISWTPRTTGQDPLIGAFNASNWNGSQFMISGDNGRTYRSPDGVSWGAVTSAGIGTQSLIWSGSQYMVSGNGGTLMTSPDGGTWTSVSPSNNDIYYSLAYSGSHYVVAGQNVNYRSGNGTSWTAITSPFDSKRRAVAWNGSSFTIVGPAGAFLTSSDGVNWLQSTMGQSFNLYAIASAGTDFVAVGFSGTIVKSPSWTQQTSGTSQDLYGIIWTGSTYIAVGGNNTILTSPDGVTWTARPPF